MSKNNFTPLANGADPDDIGNNTSNNPTMQDILAARMGRRTFMLGSAGAAVFGSMGLTGCLGLGGSGGSAPAAASETLLGFKPVAKSLADAFIVPEGYTASVIYAKGDPLFAGVAAFKNDGTDTGYDQRAGDHHDGMQYFGLNAAGKADQSGASRGLLAMNHEYIDQTTLFAAGPTALPRPAAEADIEIACHGVSVVEVAKGSNGRFATVQASPFNRRVTADTTIELAGPARGSSLMVTKFSTDGTRTRGTLNNCGTGKTPWGTLLTGEENWSGYFKRGSDAAARSAKEIAALTRYGRAAGASSRYGWETAGSDDRYVRWDITANAAGTAATDYRNEINGQGYMTEINPYDRNSVVKKRTSTGRFAHEGAAFSLLKTGKPLAIYMGDDSQFEYIYKYVSDAVWDPADAKPADPMATGDKYLDNGKLYVAKFNADGTGTWLELSMANPRIAGYASYAFADQADILVNARVAADAAGATKMDRPEWSSTHPTTGDIYFTLTNNSGRVTSGSDASKLVDAANPRSYTDIKNGTTTQRGNVNGHILRLAEQGDANATTFQWDVYLFGSEAGAIASINLSGLTDVNDFSSPDGLQFADSTGICWIQTDDGNYTDMTNDQMLAALPGRVGDGGKVSVANGSVLVDTYVGKKPTTDTLKRFLVGPKGCEVTGVAETPDGKVMFVNIQHPGEGTAVSDLGDPSKYVSQWPSNSGYGAGKRPRSATVMIVKNDGGRIGT